MLWFGWFPIAPFPISKLLGTVPNEPTTIVLYHGKEKMFSVSIISLELFDYIRSWY